MITEVYRYPTCNCKRASTLALLSAHIAVTVWLYASALSDGLAIGSTHLSSAASFWLAMTSCALQLPWVWVFGKCWFERVEIEGTMLRYIHWTGILDVIADRRQIIALRKPHPTKNVVEVVTEGGMFRLGPNLLRRPQLIALLDTWQNSRK